MTKHSSKIISIDSLEPGMITAQDIFTDSGHMLMAVNTELDEKHIKKLRLYQVQDIPIKEILSDANLDRQYAISSPVPIKEKKEFEVFESSYIDHSKSLKAQMLDIGDGKNVNISELFSISDNLMTTVKHRSNLFNFLNNLQSFDDYTYSHCINVSLISHVIGQWLGFKDEELMHISVAGLLHDIGKTKINIDILNKPGKLTDAEYNEIKNHTLQGYQLIEKQDIPYNIKMAVLMHHERYDGSGYPFAAKNNQINDYAKIIAIADVYDALTSDRPYRSKYSPFYVISRFEQEYLGKLDTKFLMTFLQNIAYCYLDNWCILSTGEEAKIIFINKQFPSSPIVQVDSVILDLSQEQNILIDRIL